ncbi:hypothetical protein D3C85_1569100 [compost metagenome]
MLQAVLHERLQRQLQNIVMKQLLRRLNRIVKPILEAVFLNLQIAAQMIELLLERNFLAIFHPDAQQIAEPDDHLAHFFSLILNRKHVDRFQGIE